MSSLKDWVAQGPFTLALSSSYFGFFAHAGLMMAFEEAGVRPAKITGASAGALVGGAWASGMSAVRVRELLFGIRRADFWDPGLGLGLLRGGKFKSILAQNFVSRFEDTTIPFEAAVFDILRRRTEYLRSGPLASAVVASCAVPGLFQPVRREGRWLWDGGVLDKPGFDVSTASKSGERVLSVMLESGSAAVSLYEKRWAMKGLRARTGLSDLREFRIAGLPSVNFNRLEAGPRAYLEAYGFTAQSLEAIE